MDHKIDVTMGFFMAGLLVLCMVSNAIANIPANGTAMTECQMECDLTDDTQLIAVVDTAQSPASYVNVSVPCETIICAPSAWGDWSAWNITCDGNCYYKTKERNRTCISYYIDQWTDNKYNCTCPGDDIEIEECNEASCMEPRWTVWAEWQDCTLECGNVNNKTHYRQCHDGYNNTATPVTPPPTVGHDGCPGLDYFVDFSCATVDCFFSEWGDWNAYFDNCTNQCDLLNHTRDRYCMPHYHVGWTDEPYNCSCPGDHLYTENCTEAYCLELKWGEWESWPNCTDFCGNNTINRTRPCLNRYNQSEIGCEDQSSPSLGLGIEYVECGPINCSFGYWSDWSNWTECSEYCSDDLPQAKENNRTCLSNSTHLWRGDVYIPLCSGSPDNITACNMTLTYLEENYSWNGWSACSSLPCGPGNRTRTMACTLPGNCNLDNAPEPQTCNYTEEECPIHGGWTSWTPFSSCSETCGAGVLTRTRDCTDPEPEYNGDDCLGVNIETTSCLLNVCRAAEAEHSSWTQWSGCLAIPCLKMNKTRNRICTQSIMQCVPGHGCPPPPPCNDTAETEECDNIPCPALQFVKTHRIELTANFINETYSEELCNITTYFPNKTMDNYNEYVLLSSMLRYNVTNCGDGSNITTPTQLPATYPPATTNN